MNLLRKRMMRYDLPQRIKDKGVYPYFRSIESGQDTEVVMNGRHVLMFGSNSYLGLTNHPRVIEAAVEATRKYGTGCAGSRFLNGTIDLHLQLERELAAWVGKEEAMVYSTGFQVNLGVVSCVTGRDDYVICDEFDHASIVEGRRLSFSTPRKYRHADMASLERELQRCRPDSIKLIVTDGVFSMEGDIAPLTDIVRLARKYDANVMVDEAHGFGVLGPQGRGACHHLGVADGVDLIMGTFSKSFASIGGFIASDSDTINYLRHNSRSYIFSASLTPAATAAALASLHIMQDEPEHIERLWEVTRYALDGFRALGFEIGATETPIIPLYVRDMDKTFLVTRMLFDEGIFVNPVVPPACASGDTLIRFSLMATHTKRQVDYALEKMTKCFRKIGIL
ncbi:MAG: pyridoxal phosphate-dependent aminotransferase family protein [Bacteroidaceae bacterium]|nr:pyridoxal phosphate-dependent aminotransferase family protein [Bacteroidaceae bacterium]